MQSLGQKLREERERRGLTIDQVAQSLRISPAYFEAIEEDRRDELPGGFFYRSFARQYARLLEMPESAYRDELARALEADIADSTIKIENLAQRHIDVPPMPTGAIDRAKETRKWVIGLVLLVAVAAGASGLYKLYMDWRPSEASAGGNGGAMTPPVQMPESNQPQAANPAAQPGSDATATPPAGAETAGGQTAGTTPGTAPDQSTIPPTSNPQGTSSSPVAPTSNPVAGTVTSPSNPVTPTSATGPVQVALTATDPVWVDVVADGKRVLTRTLETGETQNFGAGQAIRLRTGNAGGLRIVYNGRAIDAVGPKGQVRTVTFTPQTYEVAQPMPPVGAVPKPATEAPTVPPQP